MLNELFKRNKNTEQPSEYMAVTSKYEEGALLLESMPNGVQINTLDSARHAAGHKRGYKYGARYKLGRQVYGNSLVDVITKLEKQHPELITKE